MRDTEVREQASASFVNTTPLTESSKRLTSTPSRFGGAGQRVLRSDRRGV